MEIKRATSQSGVTYRIMDDGNPILGINIYSIEYKVNKYSPSEVWDIEPSSPITTNKQGIEALFQSLINI